MTAPGPLSPAGSTRVDTGAALATEMGQSGAGGRAMYDPRPGDADRWDWAATPR
ncbi:hypothetical protein ACLGIH_33730 [Streptomyces sp. HMX87]|uniref:hypothetical protein n=1 Tax=Streptomyces sp. HMX87 TaxID=3390849 RepID=UPI003A8AB9CB